MSSSSNDDSAGSEYAEQPPDCQYQTLFWVPILQQTAQNVENLIEDMLELIQDFHDQDCEITVRRSILSETTRYNLMTILKSHFLFSQLRDFELDDVIDQMQQGDANGELFYILEEGRCEVLINDNSIDFLQSGSSFGDLSLMYNSLVSSASSQNGQLMQFLSKISLFEGLSIPKRTQLVRSLTKQGDIGEKFYVIFKGKVIVTMTDDNGNSKFLIELGEGEGGFVDNFNRMNDLRNVKSLAMFKSLNEKRLKELMDTLHVNKMFLGQRFVCETNSIVFVMSGRFESSVGNSEYSADSNTNVVGSLESGAEVVAGALSCVSEEGSLAVISREIVTDLLQKNDEDQSTNRKSSGKAIGGVSSSSSAANRERRSSLAKYTCDNLTQLKLLQLLGKGTFGKVFLGHHHYVRREVQALKHFQHPFISEYYGIVQSPRKIFISMEFISGGELWSHLYDNVESSSACGLGYYESALYTGSMLLALEHIHLMGFCYRDLKPENLLISANGYLKIVDYGFTKQVPFVDKAGQIQYRTFTLCGTPDYMAPELVLTQGHDRSVDYWALGVILFELICGYTPFESNHQKRTFEKIVHSQKYLSFPAEFDPHCKSLIRRLMHPNPALRLGALQNGIADIKNHAFFSSQNIDFEKLLDQQIEMPYQPAAFQFEWKNEPSSQGDQIDFEFEESVL
eukprot:gene32797-42457_t